MAVRFFATGWAFFVLNYLVANLAEGSSRTIVVFADILQIAAFGGFFAAFALTFSLCIGVISKNGKPAVPSQQETSLRNRRKSRRER
jgi:hypothetical protein